MIAILSPAKSLNFGNPCATDRTTEPKYHDRADELAAKLAKLSARKVGSLMNISPALADLNHERYQTWSDAPMRPAISVFTGEVYRGMDAGDMNAEELEFAQDHLRILSGLYGLLRPLDLIKPYRLEMGSRWPATKRVKNLYVYWGDDIRGSIEEDLDSTGGSAVINLASTEYSKAAKLEAMGADVYNFHFRDMKNGVYKSIQTYAKLARGMMARYMIKEGITQPEGLKGFDYEGYGYNKELSDGNEWVFTRG